MLLVLSLAQMNFFSPFRMTRPTVLRDDFNLILVRPLMPHVSQKHSIRGGEFLYTSWRGDITDNVKVVRAVDIYTYLYPLLYSLSVYSSVVKPFFAVECDDEWNYTSIPNILSYGICKIPFLSLYMSVYITEFECMYYERTLCASPVSYEYYEIGWILCILWEIYSTWNNFKVNIWYFA